MPTLSTHVLDVAAGRPAEGVAVTLSSRTPVGDLICATTDADGRIVNGLGGVLPVGVWRLSFALGPYFAGQDREGCVEEVDVLLRLTEERHYHVPLLATPHSATTYLGT